MCRNIKPLFNFDPPTTEQEVRDASLQFVRKLTGFRTPSKSNEKAFAAAVEKITGDVQTLLDSLTTQAPKHNREVEAERAHARALKRFGKR
jgi:hypothetical protein